VNINDLIVPFSTTLNRQERRAWRQELSWPELATLCTHHEIGLKDGTAIICGLFLGDGRKGEALVGRGSIALDIEANKGSGEIPPDPKDVIALLKKKRLAAALWSTHSNSATDLRYRILMPLSAPLAITVRETDALLPFLAAAQLKLTGIADSSKFGGQSLFFLPRHDYGRPYWSAIIEGEPLDALELQAVATMVHQRDRMSEEQLRELHRAAQLRPAKQTLIDRFNAKYSIEDLLRACGYQQFGARFRSPYQSRDSAPATHRIPGTDRWFSHSESDRGAGIGRPCSAGVWGTSFDLFRHYMHDGDWRAALKAAEQEIGRPRPSGASSSSHHPIS
jgi:hypothetical protein